MSLDLPAMIAASAPDAPPRDPSPPAPLRCQSCPSLITQHHFAGMAAPHGTSARCLEAAGGVRLIGWEWKPQDTAPHWCPRGVAA
jgi:hypothetical protein